jgi:16S rRNA (cytosine967-C5)-methyltransferase
VEIKTEFIDNIRKVQSEVLESYSKIVKPGGKLVYATCSILPSENQEQIARFLTTDMVKNSTSLKIKKFWLQNLVLTVFMALLERKEQVLKPKESKAPRENSRIIKLIDY